MTNKKEFLIDTLFMKLKNKNTRKINLEKKELIKFINYLINNE